MYNTIEETDGARFIDFVLLVRGKNMIIEIRNSFSGELSRSGNAYRSTKKGSYHGIGLAHVESIISKYQGHIRYEHDTGSFETKVMLPLIMPGGGR